MGKIIRKEETSKLIVSHIGEINTNSYGTPMVIVEYKNTRNTVVEFQDEYKYRMKVTYDRFVKGNISNPYDKTMYGIGYLGVGLYKSSKKIFSAHFGSVC